MGIEELWEEISELNPDFAIIRTDRFERDDADFHWLRKTVPETTDITRMKSGLLIDQTMSRGLIKYYDNDEDPALLRMYEYNDTHVPFACVGLSHERILNLQTAAKLVKNVMRAHQAYYIVHGHVYGELSHLIHQGQRSLQPQLILNPDESIEIMADAYLINGSSKKQLHVVFQKRSSYCSCLVLA